MRKRFTQGSIIQDIRSSKYKRRRCFGIVISARCDIAQDKLEHFHCLSAMTLEDWTYDILFYTILKEYQKNVKNKICSLIQLSTVFRNSPQIAELCASIISSGVLLFDGFVNPYKYCSSSFVDSIEQKCGVPRMIMYENDTLIVEMVSLQNWIRIK